MGPVFNSAAYWTATARSRDDTEERDAAERRAAAIDDAVADALVNSGPRSIEAHPDLQQLADELREWYLD